MKKTYAAAALALTSCLVLGAAAASQAYNVTATFRPDMTLKVNGTTYTIRDTTGQVVSPLVYNGTTYLPLANLGQLLGAEVSWDGATQTVIITDSDSAAASIGEAKAKEIALQHAGLTADQVTFLQLKLDWENGRQVYEVEFRSGGMEYEYNVRASDGAILDSDWDLDDDAPASGTSGVSGTSGGSAVLDRDSAVAAALAHAGVSAGEVFGLECELDEDDGRRRYEIEFETARAEYEYEIDAATGAILKAESERED